MDTILSIVKWLIILGFLGKIISNGYISNKKKIIYCILSLAIYNFLGSIVLIVALLIIYFVEIYTFEVSSSEDFKNFMKKTESEAEKLKYDVRKALRNYLINKKIIKSDDIVSIYFKSLGRALKDSEQNEKSLQNLQKIGSEFLTELSKKNSKIPVVKIDTPKGIFYCTQETLDELRQIGQRLGKERIISVKQLGDWGIQNEELAYVCLNGINDFPFTCYTYFIENLELPNGDIIKIPYEMINKKVAAEEFTCSKCYGIFQKIFDHGGEKFCSNCIEEVKGAEREGKSVVFEVNPDEMPMTGDTADIFAELDRK